jgi:tetratricopeptide (TPR) repeat protein
VASLVAATSSVQADQPESPPPGPTTVPLFDNLGTLHHPITTSSEQAQHYFDQGLRLMYGFNHEEAINSFREAARLDPTAAMPYWGVALALGPNINATMDKKQEQHAREALKQATARAGTASHKEQAYIGALASRYYSGAGKKPSSRATQDTAYANAMRSIAHQFPDDPDASTLFVEALMDLSPWHYWTADNQPTGHTDDILTTLEQVLAQHPDHPGACHLYIHALEASPFPERALDCARRLPDLMPGAGHLVHMPAHLYIRLGRYQEATERNQQAVRVDRDYLAHRQLTGSYADGYAAHNLHFLWATLLLEGRSAEALTAARELVATVPLDNVRKEPSFEVYTAAPLQTLVRFGRWVDILHEPIPDKTLVFTQAIWRFARGMSHAATGRLGAAAAELKTLQQQLKATRKDQITGVNATRTLLHLSERLLAGELASKRGDTGKAVAAFKEAVGLEDSLHDTEPPDWPLPARHLLGAMLLTDNKPAEAEIVYQDDLTRHPKNGWALAGLVASLRAQGKPQAAEEAELVFREAWARADITLTESRIP